MDVITLRKLTFKSKMLEGKFKGATVQELLDGGHKAYLIWLYYHVPNISFVDEVLDAIPLFEEDRIEKPSKCTEMYTKVIARRVYARGGNIAAMKYRVVVKSLKKKEARRQAAETERICNESKASLTWRNQGHAENVLTKYRCLYCGRILRYPVPHLCMGGYRKRHLKFAETNETKGHFERNELR